MMGCTVITQLNRAVPYCFLGKFISFLLLYARLYFRLFCKTMLTAVSMSFLIVSIKSKWSLKVKMTGDFQRA